MCMRVFFAERTENKLINDTFLMIQEYYNK